MVSTAYIIPYVTLSQHIKTYGKSITLILTVNLMVLTEFLIE